MAKYLGSVVFERVDVHIFSRKGRVVLNVVWDYADADFCPYTGHESSPLYRQISQALRYLSMHTQVGPAKGLGYSQGTPCNRDCL